MVTREEIERELWSEDAFIEIETGINTAIRKIRRALGDDAEEPRYLHTVVGRGYRFVAPNAEDAGSPEKPSFSAEELGKAIMTAAGLDSKSQTGFCFRPPHLPQTGNWPHDGLNCSCGSQGESLGRLHCQSQQTTIYGMDSKLGKLTRVDLREIWKNEEYDFSNWLAGEENLIQLSDEIGISIRLIEKEAGVGKYSLDILAEEEGTGRKIIIEKPQRRNIGTTFQSRVPKLTSA